MACRLRGKIYDAAESFLLGFNPNVYYDPMREIIPDDELVQMAFKDLEGYGKQGIIDTIEEVREVLAMEPFPWEWVEELIDAQAHNEQGEWAEGAEDYKWWLTKIINKFEFEAKLQGKL